MYSFAVAAVQAAAHTMTVPKALSGIFGSISLTAWICLLLPQLVANYKAKSADGLSMAFLIVWLLGDATNLIGALFTKLAPTAIALASYFCIADCVLICQCVYYNTRNARHLARMERQGSAEVDEDAPLLARRRSSSVGLPGSHRRRATHTESSMEPIRKVLTGEDETKDSKPWLHNTMSLLAVYLVGFLGWFVSYKAGAWDADEPVHEDPTDAKNPMQVIGMTLGYTSAVLYLCARVPQIVKNYKEKSCEGMCPDRYKAWAKLTWIGLALLFFMLSLTGNLTYGISLVCYSQDKKYLITTIPWLIGSLGTIIEDCIIFVQFRLYDGNSKTLATTTAE